jgi:aspartokinase/homoserine dehydrogenase 1
MIVMKFGGTSVGSIDAFRQVARIVAQTSQQDAASARPGVIVVTSAMSGVTNLLIDAAQTSATGNLDVLHSAIATLTEKHAKVLDALISDSGERATLDAHLAHQLAEFTRLCESIAVLGELTPRGLDVVSGLGERINAPVLAAILRAHGVASEAVDATEIVVTDGVFGGAEPLMDATTVRARARLLPLTEAGIVPVVTGFVGTTESGIPTTLGRGGSDYSGAILGAAVDADEIQIWTDVNGVMTADPRIVPTARSISNLSYEEVAELAYYGAKVLHPKTVIPAIVKRIPVRVLNTFEPAHPGTVIREHSDSEEFGTVKGITAIRGMTLVTIAGRGMAGVPGIAARVFGAVARSQGNILMISQASSELNICFVVPQSAQASAEAELRTEFKREIERGDIDRIEGQPGIVIVAVVGGGMRGTPGLAAGVFTATAQKGINVIAIAQGSSEANISFVIEEKNASNALRAIHDHFELEKPTLQRSRHAALIALA